MKDEIQGKEEIIQSLQKTIFKKGKQNQRLSEVVNTFKNQLIVDQVFQQAFGAVQVGQLKQMEFTVSKSIPKLTKIDSRLV